MQKRDFNSFTDLAVVASLTSLSLLPIPHLPPTSHLKKGGALRPEMRDVAAQPD